MNLGEKIYVLRTRKNLSQGDLANALDVSRQSVSKWETNSSVPELDKLVKLSELFEVSLDELVRDKSPETPEEKVIYVEKQEKGSAGKIAGVILLSFGAMIWLLLTLFGGILEGLILALPFAAFGLICLFVKKNTGLWCMWVLYGFVDLYMRFATGVHWQYVFIPFAYAQGLTIQLIVAWVLVGLLGVLVAITVFRFRKTTAQALKGNAIGTGISWAAWFLIWLVLVRPFSDVITKPDQIALHRTVATVSGCLRTAALVAAIVFTVRAIVSLRDNKK